MKLMGLGLPGSKILLITAVRLYSCTRKILKETETEETIVFFVTFLLLVAFQWGGRGLGPLPYPFGYAYVFRIGQFIYNHLRVSNVLGLEIKI